MTNHGLLFAWARITAFWISIIVLFSDVTGFIYLSFALVWALGIAVISTLFGVVCFFSYRYFFVEQKIAENIEQTSCRGGKISIGVLPQYPPPKQGGFNPVAFNEIMDFEGYARVYPAHAALMLAGARVMMSVPGLPASPVPGGHGGATLLEHSFNVVKAMGRLAPTWKFYGHKNKDGSYWHQVKPVNGRDYHAFNMNDPLLPLTAFLHDIGKVVCYELQKDGTVREKTRTAFLFDGSVLDRDKSKRVKIEHDTEGARLLRRMPELWDLPREDSRALLFAVSYYHKVGSVPASEWITDRARSLIELLIEADNLAGRMESGEDGAHPLDQDQPAAVTQPPVHAAAPNVQAPSQEQAAPVPEEGEEEEQEKDPDELRLEAMLAVSNLMGAPKKKAQASAAKPPVREISPPPPSPAPAPVVRETASVPAQAVAEGADSEFELSDHDPEMLSAAEFDVFLDILLQENRINGKDARVKIGYKYGEWLYISDAHLRSALAKELSDPSFATTQEGVIHPWTRRLLKRLDAMGALKKDFDGMQFRYVSAMFTTESKITSKEGTKINETKYVMLVRASILGTLERIPDCLYPPRITKCSWGNNRAINKPKPGVQSAPTASIETASQDAPRVEEVNATIQEVGIEKPSSTIPETETPVIASGELTEPEIEIPPSPDYEGVSPDPEMGDIDLAAITPEPGDGEIDESFISEGVGGIDLGGEDEFAQEFVSSLSEDEVDANENASESNMVVDGGEIVGGSVEDQGVPCATAGDDSPVSAGAAVDLPSEEKNREKIHEVTEELCDENQTQIGDNETAAAAIAEMVRDFSDGADFQDSGLEREGYGTSDIIVTSENAHIQREVDLNQITSPYSSVEKSGAASKLNALTPGEEVDQSPVRENLETNVAENTPETSFQNNDYDFSHTLPRKNNSLELDLSSVLRDVLLGKNFGPQPKSVLPKPGGKIVGFFDLEEALEFYRLDSGAASHLDIKDGSNSGRKYIRIET